MDTEPVPITPVITLDGRDATLSFSGESEDCSLSVEYHKGLFAGDRRQTFSLKSGANICTKRQLCVIPVLRYLPTADAIATNLEDETAFDGTGEFFVIPKSSEIDTLLAFTFNLEGIVGSGFVESARLTMQISDGVLVDAPIYYKSVPSFPANYGDLEWSDAGRRLVTRNHWIELPITYLIQQAILDTPSGDPVGDIHLALRWKFDSVLESSVTIPTSRAVSHVSPFLTIRP